MNPPLRCWLVIDRDGHALNVTTDPELAAIWMLGPGSRLVEFVEVQKEIDDCC